MNWTESIGTIRDRLSSLSQEILTEDDGDKSYIPHFEDSVFRAGTRGANHAVQVANYMVKNPRSITIKYDGKVALIFGIGDNGKFMVADKHMFNRKDGTGRQIHSPQDLQNYDINRGKNRGTLYQEVAALWPGLQKSHGNASGYYWGDMLFSQPLKEDGGQLKFRGNERGITYVVDPGSDIGQTLMKKSGAVAVHNYLPPHATSTKYAQPLNGTIGRLRNDSNIEMLPCGLHNAPKIQLNTALINAVNESVKKYGAHCDTLLRNPSVRSLAETFINSKVKQGNLQNLVEGFNQHCAQRGSQPVQQWVSQCQDGVKSMFATWIALYNLKMDLWKQIQDSAADNPIKGYLDNGTPEQEGFVCGGYKLTNRVNGFSRQNLNNQ